MNHPDPEPLTGENAPTGSTATLPTAGGRETGWWAVGAFALLTVAVVAVYGPTTHAPFIFDDVPCIEDNRSIRELWPLVGTKDEPGPLRPPQDFTTAGRPLVNLSLALNVAFCEISPFGKLNPFGFHVVNMLLHALNATLIWALVRGALRLDFFGGRFDRAAGPLAFLVALLWALHPLQTEAVQYVSQRTELMMGFFYLATMHASLRYFTAANSRNRTAWLIWASLACAAGMACKEVMVSAPAMVLLFDRTFLSGSFLRALRKSWPLYLALFLTWGVLLALNVGGPRSASAGFHLNVSAHAWWFTQCQVLLMYLKLCVWPWPLVIHYEFPYLETIAAAWPWLLAVGGLALLTLLLVWKRTAAGFLCVWMVAILSPTLVVPIVTEIAVERRMYLPLIAPVAMFVVGGCAILQWLANRWAGGAARAAARWTVVVMAGAVLVCAAGFAALDLRRLAAYDDPLTLWEDANSHQPDNYAVHVNYAVELLNQGHAEEALKHLETALAMNDEDAAKVHAVMGKAHLLARRPAEARKHLEISLQLQPSVAEVRGNLGHVLLHQYRNIAEALPLLEEAYRARPDSLEVRQDLAMAYINTGRSAEAIDLLEPVVRLKPEMAEGHRDMGLALGNLGRAAEAIRQFEQAVRLDPKAPELHQYLGMALLNDGKYQSAIEALERSLELNPQSADAHYYTGVAHLTAGRAREAAAEFQRALDIQPGHEGARLGLQKALAAGSGK